MSASKATFKFANANLLIVSLKNYANIIFFLRLYILVQPKINKYFFVLSFLYLIS